MSLTWNRTVDWSAEDWRDKSACKNVDPSMFFPGNGPGTMAEQTDAAKQVCETCAVRSQCLEFALRANQETGVWGGTSEDERRKLRRQWLAARRRGTPMVV